jgi:universal stress protein E
VIGSHDDAGLWQSLFGRTSLHLLRGCPCPVLVARPPADDGFRQILVPTDLGSASTAALQFGAGFLHLADGGCLHVLHMVEYPLDRVWSPTVSDDWTEAYERKIRAEAEATIRAQLTQAGFTPRDNVVLHLLDGAGIPDQTILQFTRDQRIDLLILGTAQSGGLLETLLGHTAERLLSEVRCSIVSVKAS